jgi:hypothetical protein
MVADAAAPTRNFFVLETIQVGRKREAREVRPRAL